jgi:hypothetical protein
MAVFIAALFLIGVIAVKGGTPDKASTTPSEPTPNAEAIGQSGADGPFLCGAKGPRRRDLTVPHVTRAVRSSKTPGGRERCQDD